MIISLKQIFLDILPFWLYRALPSTESDSTVS